MFKNSSFNEFISKNKIDLTINDNFFIKKIISEKKFSLLDFFWYNDKVNLKLKNENPEIHQYCFLYFKINEAISNNDIDSLKELLKNSFENTLINENYFSNCYLLKAVDEGKYEVVEVLLKDCRFNLNFLDGYAIRHSIVHNYKDIFLLLLNNENIKFNINSVELIFSYYHNHLKPENYYFFFNHLIKNKIFKNYILSSDKLKETYNEIISYYFQNKIDIF